MEIQIGKTLTSLLEQKRWSISALSKETKVPQTTLREWTSNRVPKNPVQVKKVAEALGVSMHYLYFGVDEESAQITNILKQDLFSGTFEINIKRVNIKEP